MEFRQSSKLNEVCYEIRGPVIEQANALEEAGHSVLRLNTGNPALFGFEAPEEIVQDMIRMLPQAHGYTDSRAASCPPGAPSRSATRRWGWPMSTWTTSSSATGSPS
ncbi:hypothetical protein RKD45_001671 [Streptomyces griseus]